MTESSATVPIGGSVEHGFEPVREAFLRNFEQHGDVGAALAVHREGRAVVDLWGGIADPVTGRPYDADTLQVVFSATKGPAAACVNLLIQRGALDPNERVATYWPEFGQGGKEDVLVRWLVSHRAGLPTVDGPVSLADVLTWEPVVRLLEAQAPYWPPGSAHGYHAITFGWLVGELVRRVDGRTIARFLEDEIAQPLGVEFWIGMPVEHEARVAPVIPAPPPTPEELHDLAKQFGPDTFGGRVLSLNGALQVPDYNRPEVRAAEIPGAVGVTSARSLSRLYAGLVGPLDGAGGGGLLTEAQIEGAATCQTSGTDRVLSTASAPMATTFGLGFMTPSPAFARLGTPGSFGHSGTGGSFGFADPRHRVSVAYVPNQMRRGFGADPRGSGIVRAVYDAIGVTAPFV